MASALPTATDCNCPCTTVTGIGERGPTGPEGPPGPTQIPIATLLATPVNGKIEFDGTSLYFTIGGVRYQFAFQP